jgi:hypothetical protein
LSTEGHEHYQTNLVGFVAVVRVDLILDLYHLSLAQ